MSYFHCGMDINVNYSESFDNSFKELVPLDNKIIEFNHIKDNSHFVSYSGTKVIPNVFIKDINSGSWVVIIGTPLVHFKNKDEEFTFLQDFLSDPMNCIRDKIDGNFAVFGYDSKLNKFFAATDSNTTIPVFYSLTKGGIIFSSHEAAIAKYLKPDIDPFGFSQSIQIGTIWVSHTRFKGIHKLLPCQLCTFDSDHKLKTEHYWKPDEEEVWNESLDNIIDRWNNITKNSIWKFFDHSGKKPVICDFTAGEDSRLIVAHCHSLGIPFQAQVMGLDESLDVIFTKKAAQKLGFNLIERSKTQISENQLLSSALKINCLFDGYKEFFAACSEYASNVASPIDDYSSVKYCGAPGGEAFRGSYYTRGKALLPSSYKPLDIKFFMKMKFLLDYVPGLLKVSDSDFFENVFSIVNTVMKDVQNFPIGTQIDHLLRMFQTFSIGLRYKNPLYLPLATLAMTRSIYSLSPRHKRGGILTKACTEILYPELAFMKNQNGVPTIRKTPFRAPLFLPENLAMVKKVYSGAISRLMKLTQANKWYYSLDWNASIFVTLLNRKPYCDWFASAETMVTGEMYQASILNPLLATAKSGVCKNTPILDRIITQELFFRWVHSN